MRCVLCAVFLCAVCFCSVSLAADWAINTVAYDYTGASSVAVDINNNPVLAFTSFSDNGYLFCAQQIDTGYTTEQVGSSDNCSNPKIAVTSYNEKAIGFTLSSFVWYGQRGSWFDWQFSKVSECAALFDMAVDGNDLPHIAYLDGGVYYVGYDVATQQWEKEKLNGLTGSYNLNVAISADNRIMVSSSDKTKITVAVCSDGLWYYLPTIESASAYLDGSFAADDMPAVAYVKQGILCYAVYVAGMNDWAETQIGTVDVPTGYYNSISLSHNSAGLAGIAYIDDDKLMYAQGIVGGWAVTAVDENYSRFPKLIFDKNSNPLIAYSGYDECLDLGVIKLAGIGLEKFNIADLNNDKIVNFADFVVMAENWMVILPGSDVSSGDFNEDSAVDWLDLRWLGCNWLK